MALSVVDVHMALKAVAPALRRKLAEKHVKIRLRNLVPHHDLLQPGWTAAKHRNVSVNTVRTNT